MNAMAIYASQGGNSEKIAQAIAGGLTRALWFPGKFLDGLGYAVPRIASSVENKGGQATGNTMLLAPELLAG